MKTALRPCEGCRRHVRASDPRCPFCGANNTRAEVAPPLRVSPRLGSLAKVTFRAAVVTTALGCGGRVEEPEESDPIDTDTGGQSGAGGAANTGGRPTTFVTGGYGGMNVLNDDPAPPEATGGTITVEPDPPRVEDAGAPVTIYRASPPE